MKNINNYIVEKLRINKDTDLHLIFDNGNYICKVLKINDTFNSVEDSINRWIRDNKIKEFKLYYHPGAELKLEDYKYDISKFIRNDDEIGKYINARSSKIGDSIWLYKSEKFSIVTDKKDRSNIMLIDKRLGTKKYMYFLFEP